MEVLAETLQGLDRMGVSLIIKRNGRYHVAGIRKTENSPLDVPYRLIFVCCNKLY